MKTIYMSSVPTASYLPHNLDHTPLAAVQYNVEAMFGVLPPPGVQLAESVRHVTLYTVVLDVKRQQCGVDLTQGCTQAVQGGSWNTGTHVDRDGSGRGERM